MECLVIALASPLPRVEAGLGTNRLTGGGWWAGGMKSLCCLSVHLPWEDFHSKGFYIFRISVFCFNVVNNHFKPTIFSKGLIIQAVKLVSSHHLSFLAHQNSPCSWEWQFQPYLVRAMDKKNSVVGVQCEPSSRGPLSQHPPTAVHWDLTPANSLYGRGLGRLGNCATAWGLSSLSTQELWSDFPK